jgi:hypothetical protein
MKIELDLYSPAELDAFAAFCTAVATHSRERMKSEVDRKYDAHTGEAGSTNIEVLNPIKVPDEPITQAEAEAIVQTAKVRERGKPSPGHARRTKAEIAEDDAADKADADRATQAVADRAEETVAGISTGEERTDPDNPDDVAQDSAEDAAQDALDEAHETAAAREAGGGAKTLDDVRAALGKYVKAFGMAAAQEDGPRVLSMVCGDGVTKISAVPDDKIAAVIAGIEEMLVKNPFKRAAA